MVRIFVALASLMLLGCALLIIRDVYDGNGFRVILNINRVLLFAGVTVFYTPLGILLLYNIYGIHYLAFALFSILAMIYGVAMSKRLHGQVIAVMGVLSWMFLGVYGLGHGG
ncbi:MAG: hypothetical protein AAFN76_11990 [Pseudomonadota bacterium]